MLKDKYKSKNSILQLEHENSAHRRKIIVVGIIAAIVALGIWFSSYYILTQNSNVRTRRIGNITFGPGWQYAGSVSLKGAQSSCDELRLPCPANTSNPADEYFSGPVTAYVESYESGLYTIVLINETLYCISPAVSWVQQCPDQIAGEAGLYVYQSGLFNQENASACNFYSEAENNGTIPGLAGLISNTEQYPGFVSLEGNRTYQYESWSCGYHVPLDLIFSYYDTAHPFGVCDNTATMYPKYQIVVGIDLTPTGYDLYHSVYSAVYYGPQNTTVTCISTT